MKLFAKVRVVATSSLLLATIFFLGCGNAENEYVAENPEQAASQIEQAFADSGGLTHAAALAASDAMRKGEYEKAVVSLQTVKAGTNITAEQGLAIYSSTVTLEAQLIAGVEAGDPNAIRAYQMLKAMKRD